MTLTSVCRKIRRIPRPFVFFRYSLVKIFFFPGYFSPENNCRMRCFQKYSGTRLRFYSETKLLIYAALNSLRPFLPFSAQITHQETQGTDRPVYGHCNPHSEDAQIQHLTQHIAETDPEDPHGEN